VTIWMRCFAPSNFISPDNSVRMRRGISSLRQCMRGCTLVTDSDTGRFVACTASAALSATPVSSQRRSTLHFACFAVTGSLPIGRSKPLCPTAAYSSRSYRNDGTASIRMKAGQSPPAEQQLNCCWASGSAFEHPDIKINIDNLCLEGS